MLTLLTLLACEPIPSSGRMLEPVRVTGPARAPAAAPAPASGPQGDFDFESEDREGASGEGEQDPIALQARLLGLSPDQVARPAPAPEPAPAPTAPALPAVAAPIWDPSRPLPDVQFGVRVLGVLLDLQPPRAIIGLPDGREQVVTPGAMLPAEGLVVLAIGRDAVQVARVTPSGFYARVDTETIRALYPQQGTTAP
ncbi:MAG: hypothetical protein H6738_25100 [Alphaproteobacteria bacterium]|nr:hypothetical protein [Alphaproteobacteria bacterium]MCB9700090.1 hypothetical protein [Alphaproteobacteria bacterium]